MTETKKQTKIFTVGHSTYALEDFASLLKQHGVDVIADVRSCFKTIVSKEKG